MIHLGKCFWSYPAMKRQAARLAAFGPCEGWMMTGHWLAWPHSIFTHGKNNWIHKSADPSHNTTPRSLPPPSLLLCQCHWAGPRRVQLKGQPQPQQLGCRAGVFCLLGIYFLIPWNGDPELWRGSGSSSARPPASSTSFLPARAQNPGERSGSVPPWQSTGT